MKIIEDYLEQGFIPHAPGEEGGCQVVVEVDEFSPGMAVISLPISIDALYMDFLCAAIPEAFCDTLEGQREWWVRHEDVTRAALWATLGTGSIHFQPDWEALSDPTAPAGDVVDSGGPFSTVNLEMSVPLSMPAHVAHSVIIDSLDVQKLMVLIASGLLFQMLQHVWRGHMIMLEDQPCCSPSRSSISKA